MAAAITNVSTRTIPEIDLYRGLYSYSLCGHQDVYWHRADAQFPADKGWLTYSVSACESSYFDTAIALADEYVIYGDIALGPTSCFGFQADAMVAGVAIWGPVSIPPFTYFGTSAAETSPRANSRVEAAKPELEEIRRDIAEASPRVAVDFRRFWRQTAISAGLLSSTMPYNPVTTSLLPRETLPRWLRSLADDERSQPLIEIETTGLWDHGVGSSSGFGDAVLASGDNTRFTSVPLPDRVRIPLDNVGIADWACAEFEEWSHLDYEVGKIIDRFQSADDADPEITRRKSTYQSR